VNCSMTASITPSVLDARVLCTASEISIDHRLLDVGISYP
jgi:hypothetical protein